MIFTGFANKCPMSSNATVASYYCVVIGANYDSFDYDLTMEPQKRDS